MSYEGLLCMYLKQPTLSHVVLWEWPLLTYKTGLDIATVLMLYHIFNPTTAT